MLLDFFFASEQQNKGIPTKLAYVRRNKVHYCEFVNGMFGGLEPFSRVHYMSGYRIAGHFIEMATHESACAAQPFWLAIETPCYVMADNHSNYVQPLPTGIPVCSLGHKQSD